MLQCVVGHIEYVNVGQVIIFAVSNLHQHLTQFKAVQHIEVCGVGCQEPENRDSVAVRGQLRHGDAEPARKDEHCVLDGKELKI
jgi:hypothetical protein